MCILGLKYYGDMSAYIFNDLDLITNILRRVSIYLTRKLDTIGINKIMVINGYYYDTV